jgi:hypothetical protein
MAVHNQVRLIKFLWGVILVLSLGLVAETVIALNRAKAIDDVRIHAQGSIDSLKEQVRQAKAPRPTQTPLQEAASNLAAPTPSATAKTLTPTPTPTTKAQPR